MAIGTVSNAVKCVLCEVPAITLRFSILPKDTLTVAVTELSLGKKDHTLG